MILGEQKYIYRQLLLPIHSPIYALMSLMDKVKIPAEVADMTPVLVTSMPPGDAPTAMDTDVSFSVTKLTAESIELGSPKGVSIMPSGIPEGTSMMNDTIHLSPDPMLRMSRGTNPLLCWGSSYA